MSSGRQLHSEFVACLTKGAKRRAKHQVGATGPTPGDWQYHHGAKNHARERKTLTIKSE